MSDLSRYILVSLFLLSILNSLIYFFYYYILDMDKSKLKKKRIKCLSYLMIAMISIFLLDMDERKYSYHLNYDSECELENGEE